METIYIWADPDSGAQRWGYQADFKHALDTETAASGGGNQAYPVRANDMLNSLSTATRFEAPASAE